MSRLAQRLTASVTGLDGAVEAARRAAWLIVPLQSSWPVPGGLDVAMGVATRYGDAIPNALAVTRRSRSPSSGPAALDPDLVDAWVRCQRALAASAAGLRGLGWRTPWLCPQHEVPCDAAHLLSGLYDVKQGVLWLVLRERAKAAPRPPKGLPLNSTAPSLTTPLSDPSAPHLSRPQRSDAHRVCDGVERVHDAWPPELCIPVEQPELRLCDGCGRLLGSRRGAHCGTCANRRTRAKSG